MRSRGNICEKETSEREGYSLETGSIHQGSPLSEDRKKKKLQGSKRGKKKSNAKKRRRERNCQGQCRKAIQARAEEEGMMMQKKGGSRRSSASMKQQSPDSPS